MKLKLPVIDLDVYTNTVSCIVTFLNVDCRTQVLKHITYYLSLLKGKFGAFNEKTCNNKIAFNAVITLAHVQIKTMANK